MLKEIVKKLQGFQMMEKQDLTTIYTTWFWWKPIRIIVLAQHE
jgi:hypothetical protein